MGRHMVFKFFFLIIRRPPISPLFPYTTLFRSFLDAPLLELAPSLRGEAALEWPELLLGQCAGPLRHVSPEHCPKRDRKSTRLNSSHPSISYAVFCLKKKKHSQ